MTKQEGILLFNSLYPKFFEEPYIQNLPSEWIFDEMILELENFDPLKYDRKLDDGISFGYYQGNIDEIKRAVEKVDEDWVQYYDPTQRIYCGYADGKVVSFCMIADLGVHSINGRKVKVGGPGCVGTIPQYRDKGIGLTMVKNVTQILKEEGYDYSYIHYTSEAAWYEKLGYQTSIRWTGKGIL
ncbi:MAG: GNAT family N-acetyltransferase [Ruminiclostridium sp.]|nr:GNAT family N-acetyltransferase [Ruminiclostridium sp.]